VTDGGNEGVAAAEEGIGRRGAQVCPARKRERGRECVKERASVGEA
jgi:hypothetical protein